MRRISMAARDELVAAIAGRYAQGDRAERGRILDEFAAVTGFHRKHAMRLLRAGQVTRSCGPRPDRRIYDEAVREALDTKENMSWTDDDNIIKAPSVGIAQWVQDKPGAARALNLLLTIAHEIRANSA
jgi:hypothetical protein